jgi:hypothetical protein
MILITCSCIGVGLSWAEDDHRVFISADGRSIAGKLMRYNPDKQIATIARHDGKEFQALLELFSERDQRYIREQSAMNDFMHSFRIVPKLRKLDVTRRYDDKRNKTEQIKSLGYVISLNNLSPTLFEGIEIEYCLFYRQGERHAISMEYKHGVQYGRWELASMVPDARHVLETENILIYETGSTCTLFGNSSQAQSGVDGIWLRIAATLPNGDRVLRELRSSPLTGSYHNWVTAAIPVGLNNHELN